ncbi:hypothetical protein ACS0TY_003889 [Phlomoides rotata]
MAIRQMLRRSLSSERRPAEVPKGHFAVYVGENEKRRFVIPVSYLNNTSFQELLYQAEEEFGFHHPMDTDANADCDADCDADADADCDADADNPLLQRPPSKNAYESDPFHRSRVSSRTLDPPPLRPRRDSGGERDGWDEREREDPLAPPLRLPCDTVRSGATTILGRRELMSIGIVRFSIIPYGTIFHLSCTGVRNI